MIKNRRLQLVLPGVFPSPIYRGQDFVSDFAAAIDEPVAFESAFDTGPEGTAFDSDFAVGYYRMAAGPEVYGRFRTPASSPGYHQAGSAAVVIGAGFESDFALWADPQEPFGFEGVALDSDFVTGRHVAETYPPPLSFEADFSAAPILPSFFSDFATDDHKMQSGGVDTWGNYTLSTDTFVLSGVPLRTPAAFQIDQIVPGDRTHDDRLGQFVLGHTILGGPSP